MNFELVNESIFHNSMDSDPRGLHYIFGRISGAGEPVRSEKLDWCRTVAIGPAGPFRAG